MTCRICIVWLLLCLLRAGTLCAQSVLYSPLLNNASQTRFDVIGKAGTYYWIQKGRESNSVKKRAAAARNNDFSFEVFDERLHRVTQLPNTLSDTVQKQYLVAGPTALDQLLFYNRSGKMCVQINRFRPEGTFVSADTLVCFPGSMKGDDFLLARSQDGSKLLLLGFEPVTDAPPRTHAILYNNQWQILFKTVYNSGNISQPFVQYDFTNYPSEPYDNSPVKVANNGDWLLLAPSRRSSNYVLWHFQHTDSSVAQNEIQLNQRTAVQNVSLALDEAKGEASAGLLLYTNVPAIKKVHTVHYLLSGCRTDFDTTYRCNTVSAGKMKEENLFEQSFTPVCGKGFLLLKEYGRPFVSTFTDEMKVDAEAVPSDATGKPVPAPVNRKDYIRYANITVGRPAYERGDLRLYYFPDTKQDSCWSGLINQPQTSELNSSFLSYACIPLQGKIVFLYNSEARNEAEFAKATVLDSSGNSLNDGMIFWRFNHVLQFQQARQIAANEMAVPYDKTSGRGFAIIRL